TFAPVGHRLNVALVASRGCHDAELPGGGIDHDLSIAHGCRLDPSNERACLRGADADSLRLVACALVADIDIVVAVGERHPGLRSDANVLGAEALLERLGTDRGVVVPGLVVLKGLKAERDVEIASADVGECTGSTGGVVVAGRVES